MRVLFSITAFVSVLLSTAAMAEIHTYTIPKIGHTEERCQQAESWIIEKFAKLAEASVLSHGCERNPSRTFDLVIEYAKPTVANLVSTYEEFDYVHGLYDSAEDCVAHYDEDMTIFKNQTGIEPLLAYCLREPLAGDLADSWIMRIDGFGTPKKSPQHISKDFFHNVFGDVNAMGAQLKATLDAFGAADTKVKIMTRDNRGSVHAMYYAEKNLPLVQYNEGQFNTLAACESYRDTMREIFAKAGGQSAIYFCGTMGYTSTYYVYSVGIVMQPMATELTSLKYSTFEACEAKRAETEASWRNGLQKDVIGSICAVEDAISFEKFTRMRMFWLE